jgi:streptomycin 6-kinase
MEELVERWQLKVGDEYPPGAAGRAYRVECADGTPAVLKLIHPHREALQEADALERWDGDGAIRLLARDDEHNAVLLERCEPGTPLSELETEAAMDVLVGLLPRLWKDPSGFVRIDDEAGYFADDIDTCVDARLRDVAHAYLRELLPTQGERVLVSQDLHGDNVLAAEREPWLAIDPKPLAAEREFSAAPIVRSPELGHSRRQALYRLDRLAELGLDRDRMIGWTVMHSVAWSGGADYVREHMETVAWLL